MAATVSELQVVVSADTSKAESGLSSLSGKLGSVGGTLATAFGGAAIAGVAAFAGGLTYATASAATFEAQLSAVSAVSGATAAEMDQLKTLALDLGAKTSFSAKEAAQGIEELVKAGVSITDVMGGGAAAALSLAAAGGLSVAESASIASNAMNVFSLKGSDVGHVADVIAGAANASAIDVHDFGMSLSAAGAVAATVGIGFDDLGTAIAVMGQAGIKGSDAGTSLKTMLLNLTPASKAQMAVAKELGIVTADGANKFFDATGKAKNLSEIAGVLQTATQGLTEQQKLQALQTLFGTDAIRAAAVMAKAGSEGFDEMAASIGKVTAEAVAAERLNNLKGDIEQLTGSLDTAAILIGEAFQPALRSITQGATELVNDAGPIIADFAERSATAIVGGARQMKDAWRTVQQVFAEDWAADDSIEPIALAAGNAAMKLKELADWTRKVADAAGNMGAWDNFASGLETVRNEAELAQANLGKIVTQLDQLTGAAAGSERGISLVGTAVKVVGVAFELWSISMGQGIDTMTSLASEMLSFIGVLGSAGQALASLARGDMAGYQEAMKGVAVGVLEMATTHMGLVDRTAERAQQAFSAMGVSAQTGMAETTAAVETGMTGVVATVEAQTPAAVAAADAMGTGMAAGIEASVPAMAAAAESGASGAVAAVEGQTGAASGAGQSLGSALGSGLEGGIMAYVGRVASAAASLVSSAIGAARVEADAHSPSRKTEQLGKDMADGLEAGLSKADLGSGLLDQIRDFMDAARDYVPTAREIARVESEIKGIREKSQTDALFRAQDMITVESELLRLKRDQTEEERRLLPIRQDLAAAEREVSRISSGSLEDRGKLLENDAQRKQIRLQTLDLEKQLVGLDRDSKRADGIQKQIDKLRDQDRLLGIEADQIRTTNDIAATAERRRVLGLGDILASQEENTQAIGRQIAVLGAEKSVFEANESIIKQATDNEIAYRNRLIAVFEAEGKPLADRITAGLALVEQMHNEGKISDELYNALKKQAEQTGAATTATKALGAASTVATPQMDAATQKANEMAEAAKKIAQNAEQAGDDVLGLAKSLGKLPSWFTPKGSSGKDLLGFGGGKADGGPVSAGVSYLVGERGPEMIVPRHDSTVIPFAPSSSSGGGGQHDSMEIRLKIGDQEAGRLFVTGYQVAVQERGFLPKGSL